MCINTKIQDLLQQKQELDAKIARLEQFSSASSAVRSLLENLIKEYRAIAPEELNNFLGELAMTLNETDEFDDDDPLGTRKSVEAEFCDEEDIALVAQYRELNNPIPQEAAEAIKSAIEQSAIEAYQEECNKIGETYQQITKAVEGELTEQQKLQNAEYLKLGEILEDWGFTRWTEEVAAVFGIDERDFVTTHYANKDCANKGWDIFFNIPNGGVIGILLKSPQGDFYDRSTELDEEYGFPSDLSLAEVDKILQWTKGVIDGLEYRIVPNTRLVTPTEEECNEISAKPENFDSDANQIPLPPTNSGTEKPAELTEFIKLTNSVGYIKWRDNDQILATYIGLSNKTETGDRTQTMASNRARKWAESLEGDFQAKCEVRKPKKMESDNAAMPFAYEVKVVGLSIGQVHKLSEQNFNLFPYEEEEKQIEAESKQKLPATNTIIWSVTINSYSVVSSGTEDEIKTLFADFISKAVVPTTMAITLWKGTTIVEDYRFADFTFKKADDFDELAPEYWVCWKEQIIDIRVWSTLRQTAGAGAAERLWRHNYLQAGEELAASSKFSAAIHSVRRKLGFA